jgi:cytochrome c-type biogenesis protein CcmH
MKKALLILSLLFWAMPAYALTHPDEQLRNPAQEARAHAITTQLRCVVCQNESIEDSGADIARDLRILVRRQILAGKTDAEIYDYLRARYGDYILLNPPLDARTYALWFAPLVVLLAGIVFLRPMFRRRRHR